MKNILFTILFLVAAISYGQDSTVTKLSLKGRVFDVIVSGGATQLSDLSDVSDATPTDDYALMGNGTTFASRALVEADISDLGNYAELGSVNTWTQQNTFSNTAVMSGTLLVTSNSGIILQPTDNAFAGVVRYHTPSSPLGHYALSEGIGSSWFNSDGSFNIGHTFSGPTTKTTAFDFSGITAKRTLTVPDASGTIALTSDLGGSVPDDTGSSDGDVLTTDGAGTYTWETPMYRQASTTITNPNMGSGAVEQTIVPAQGANKVIIVESIVINASGISGSTGNQNVAVRHGTQTTELIAGSRIWLYASGTNMLSRFRATDWFPFNAVQGVNDSVIIRLTSANLDSLTGSVVATINYRVFDTSTNTFD